MSAQLDPLLLADLAQAGPFGRAAVIAAAAELGVLEVPPGSNRGPRVDQYLVGFDGHSTELLCALRAGGAVCPHCGALPAPTSACRGCKWCCRFIVWCVETGARNLRLPSPIAGWGGLASARKWHDQARTRRCLTDQPAPGRVGLILSPLPHGVLIARLDGDLAVTVEGNAGNQVGSHRRPISSFDGGFVALG